ncbi:MAG: VWA domain-containing protein, partial [Planctomycetales bacterium]|nr:VWA domain-containing protein [Planctomycetales bacterium]
AVVLDNSASMRRGDLWSQAQAEVDKVLDDLEATDEIALFTFGNQLDRQLDFLRPAVDGTDDRRAAITEKLKGLTPSWEATNLGRALVTAAAELLAIEPATRSAAATASDEASQAATTQAEERKSLQIVLISDLQQGAMTESLQAQSWPDNVHVTVRALSLPHSSNATLEVARQNADEEFVLSQTNATRVRVYSSADAEREQFQVGWVMSVDGGDRRLEHVPCYVLPGKSHVLGLARDDTTIAANTLELTGDTEDFDNRFYLVPPRRQVMNMVYLGEDEPDDADGAYYYLQKALINTATREYQWQRIDTRQPLVTAELPDPAVGQLDRDAFPELLVATSVASVEHRRRVLDYCRRGANALIVFTSDAMVKAWSEVLDGVQSAATAADSAASTSVDTETDVNIRRRYSLWADIDFAHPLLAPMADARFNDFTKIQFWNVRRVELDAEADVGAENGADTHQRVLVRFDDHTPALWHQPLGSGLVWGMTSGWQPRDSNMALSTKFVPLINGLVDLCAENSPIAASYFVGETITLPEPKAGEVRQLTLPIGDTIELAQEEIAYSEMSVPGVYELAVGDERTLFAVNLDRRESNTAPMELQRLEQYGVVLGEQPTATEQVAEMRYLQDVELEHRQKIWKWLLVTGLIVLVVETVLSGYESNRRTQTVGAAV